MSVPRRRKPVLIREVIAELSKELGGHAPQKKRIKALWEKTVGENRSPHAKITSFEEGILTVSVGSASSLYEFSMEKESILRELQQHLGKTKIKDIRFQMRS